MPKTVVRNAMGAEAYDAAFHEIKAISALREMELNDSQIEDEVVADYAGKLLQNDGTLERFIESAQGKPTLLQRIAQVFRDLVNKLRGTEKAQAERALGKLEKAYREAAQAEKSGARNEDSGVKYSINNTRGMTIREQLKEYRAGRMTKHDEFYYGSAPDVLDAAGLNGRPLVMSQTDFKKAKSEKHNVPARAMTKLAESLKDPILSFETGDKIGILTKDIDGDGKPLLVGIMKNVDLDGETVNRIKSAYGLDNPQAWIGNQIKDGKELRIFDSKKADSFLDGIGYLAERPENYRMGDIVTDIRENVNHRYSLKKVTPVKPTNEDWSPGASFDQVKKAHPTLFELAADEADTRNPTQITGTVKSYRKIYDKLRAEGFDGTILDASSGLGYGTRAGRTEYGFSVDDIEPFPDAKYHPNYTDYSTLNKTYDVIISNAVLNVIPQDLRDAMVVKIGEMLNPGGRAFINVRGSDVKNAGSKVAIHADQMEYFISNTGSYQKGFTSKELVGYLRDALGDGFTVEPTKEFGAVSAVVTKKNGAKKETRYSLKARGVYEYTDAEKKQHAKDAAAYFEDGSTPRVSELAQFRYSLKRPAELENAYAEIQARVDSGEITAEEAIREKVAAVDRIYAEYVRKYGEMAPGENPARKVSVPKQTSDTTKVSQTIRTIMEAKATPESILPTLKESIANGDFDYETYTDAASKADAEKTIRDVGWDKAQRKWFNAMENGIVTKENTALGWTLYNNAVNSGNTELAIDVLNQMVKSPRNAAQALQATRILKQLSPEGQLYQVQRSVEDLQREINNRYRKDGAPKLEIDKDLAKKLMEAKDQNARDKVLEEIYKDIGRQMPSRFIDKWNAWRYLAMLGNPRTHVRNLFGNAGFMPVVGVKNLTAQAIESVASKFSPGMERTKGMFSAKLFKAALADYANIEGAAMSGGKYSDYAAANKYVEEGRQIFGTSRWKLWNKTGGRALETLRKKNGEWLDKEDVWFSKPHYANAMAQYCKANGITAEQIRSGDEKVLRKARAYAVQEAAKATYRDTNALSEAVSSIGGRWRSSDNKVKRVTGTLVEGILPFRKTPANILARGLEYSPAGLIKGLTNDLVQVKKGNMTAAQAIDNISAGLTGTGLLMLGGYMAAEGLLGAFLRGGGSGDDDKDKMDELAGRQDYSLEVGDTSITLDWLAPEALPLFVGVNLYETWKANNGEMQLSDYLNAIKNVSEPMVEMSCLQSLDDVFNSVATARYSGKSALTAVLVSAATSYITQALPTILGQAERTSEPLRMTTYTSKGKFATTDVQYFLGKSSARIPGLDYQQIPYIDAWGRTESNGAAGQRAFNNFINPAYVSTIRQSDMEKEIERLYEATEDGGVVPDRADKSIKLQEGTKYLSAEEYVKYATEKGQKSYALAEELVNSAAYQAADDTRKADMIRYAYQYATAVAKTKVSDYALRGWQAKCAEVTKKTGLSEATYITLYLEQLDVEGYKDEDGDPIANSAGLQKMEVVYNMAMGSSRSSRPLAAAATTTSEPFGNPEQLALLAGCGGAIAPPFL